MIIIRFTGGLGNQMFQNALYEKYRELGYDVYADLSFYRMQDTVKYELDIFHTEIVEASSKEISKLIDNKKDYLSRIRRLFYRKREYLYMEDPEVHYEPEIFSLKKAYLDGYWQSEKYFIDIRDRLLSVYSFPISNNQRNIDVLNEMRNCNSVSIHVRRGDYLKGRAKVLYGNICTCEYYKNAVLEVRERIANPVFYVFSDDVEWVQENLKIENARYINWNNGVEDYYDMYLMSQCKCNIIANSSFSWWGAWLNQNEDKIVISPSKWFNLHIAPDLICDDWIRVK